MSGAASLAARDFRKRKQEELEMKFLGPIALGSALALGAAAVVAAQQGIVNGLHPLMSACLSITIA